LPNDSEVLFTEEVDRLSTLIEEATRASADSPRRFIEPARGTLQRAKSKRHHLVFGRRGSGKTSLLRKALADLALDRTPAAFVDLEAFKGHSYPDVLLSVLIETFRTFEKWLDTAGRASSSTPFWRRLFGGTPRVPPLNKAGVEKIRGKISAHIKALEVVLHSVDNASIAMTVTKDQETTSKESIEAGLTAPEVGGYKASKDNAKRDSAKTETREDFHRSKHDYLLRHILDFQQTFEDLSTLAGGPVFVFLDDLYYIRRRDQADVLDYFHRIAKGRPVWLKAGSIRHRTEWYHHGDPPRGLKIGDDADDIDLDITLEKYALARTFLVSILDKLVEEAGLHAHSKILAAGGVDRLVLASGGVARDFLTILRRAIDIARERREAGGDSRGKRIGAEDVNTAAGEHDQSKRDEMKRDTLEEREALEVALKNVQDFCIEQKVNCFFVEQDSDTAGAKLLGELVDLRFIHLVRSRVTVRGSTGVLFSAYMLDVSQYMGVRKRRDIQMINFWESQALDTIRQPAYVLRTERISAGVEPDAVPRSTSTKKRGQPA
jgi:hypothetical protein